MGKSFMSNQATVGHAIPVVMSRESQIARYARQRRWEEYRYVLYTLPLLIYLLTFYLYPVATMLVRSFQGPNGLTLEYFAQLFESPAYSRIFWETIKLSVVTTVWALLLAYPLAYCMAQASPTRTGVMMALVLVPFWTSVLVRSYAWMVLLGREGIVNQFLLRFALTEKPVELLYSRFAVYLAMVHILLPFMVLPLYSVMAAMDRNLIRAADGLGATPRRIFQHIVLPLSIPGIAAGCLLVFILALGFYITPALVGGPRDMTVSTLIGQQLEMYEWNFAAALAAILLGIALISFAVFDKAIGMDKLFKR